MTLPNTTVVQLQHKGIRYAYTLIDYNKDPLDQSPKNLLCTVGGVKPFVFGEKSHKGLLIACELIHYYETIRRPLTDGDIQ